MNKTSLPLILFLSASCTIWAQEQYSDQTETRENPQIDTVVTVTNIKYPSYVKVDKNFIHLNGDDWSSLAETLGRSDSMRVNIVHIGDSHLQADFCTSVTRHRLGERYGSAGRGLIVPFRLAGTNQPVDYNIRSTSNLKWARLLKTPWEVSMGFTGVSISPLSHTFEIDLSCKEPFDSIEVLYSGAGLYIEREDTATIATPGLLKIGTPSLTNEASLKFNVHHGTTIHGFNLLSGNKGVAYNVVGNNGATYSTYNAIDNFASEIAKFNPALVIISLGTNEAFGKTSYDAMYSHISFMVNQIRKTCPDSKLLLTTPAECQRKVVTRRRKKGKRRKYISYIVNANIERMRRVIVDFGRKENVPVYDFYDVAGNSGSSYKWLSDHYLNKDRIHLTYAGYTLQGNLFTDALEDAIDKTVKIPLQHE